MSIMVAPQYIFGIILALIATIIFNFIPVLQKDALDKMAEVSFNKLWDSVKMMFSDKKWVFGLLMGLIGGIPYTIAVNWTGISVVQPLMNFGFIVLVIFANRILNEKLNLTAKAAIVMMIMMPIFIAFGDVSQPQNDISQPATFNSLLLFTGIVLLSIIVMFIFTKRFPILYTIITGFFFALGAYSVQFVMSMVTAAGYDLIPDIFIILGNAFSDPLLTKALIGVIAITIMNMLAGFVMQIGLQRVAASKFNPIQQTLNNIVTVIGGILVFGQAVGNWAFYFLGMGLGVMGTLILGQYQLPPKKKVEDIDSTPEKENTLD
jgi:drug/metabolite transporter (DMT)-like permease